MLADFLNEPPRAFRTSQKLKKDWDMTDDDLEVLERWIEGPISISKAVPGFFQDVGAQVTPADLKDAKKAGTVGLLSELIWQGIPHANRE